MSEVDKNPHSLNKSKIAKKLQERFADDKQKMSLAYSSRIVDAIFGVASDEDEEDGILAEHLRKSMESIAIEKEVQKGGSKKVFKYRDLIYNKVTIPSFGTFRISFRAARKGVHPKDQERVDIAESFVISFQPGKALKSAFRKGVSKRIDDALRKAKKAHAKKEEIRQYKSKK